MKIRLNFCIFRKIIVRPTSIYKTCRQFSKIRRVNDGVKYRLGKCLNIFDCVGWQKRIFVTSSVCENATVKFAEYLKKRKNANCNEIFCLKGV